MNNRKYNLGQYFTTNEILKEKLFSFILNNPDVILEPSIGQGDLVDYVSKKSIKVNVIFDMYEIDKNIKLLPSINKNLVIYGDFIKQNINKKYNTIIGNPPYIKTTTNNLYIIFIEKCYNLLEINGELIFIVPSDFLKLTSANKLLNIMMCNSNFTHIFHPNDENLFYNASINVIIFRYVKIDKICNKIFYNDKLMYILNTNGLILSLIHI
jgi:adenine-specific DNA-methyltransferase